MFLLALTHNITIISFLKELLLAIVTHMSRDTHLPAPTIATLSAPSLSDYRPGKRSDAAECLLCMKIPAPEFWEQSRMVIP
jgi:hypothetical protein